MAMGNCSDLSWVPLKVSHVEYVEGDSFGKFLALVSLLPIITYAGIGTFLLHTRDLHTITVLFGMCINDVLNLYLKKVIGEHRPHCHLSLNLKEDFGMPSNHTQCIWFFIVYVTLYTYLRIPTRTHGSIRFIESILTIIGLQVGGILMMISRVYLGYHTTKQVIFGSLLGASLGCFWYIIVLNIFKPTFSTIMSWKISKVLLIKDLSQIPNIVQFEYDTMMLEMKRQGKMSPFKKKK